MGLARGFGRKVRNLIRDPRYRDVFDTVLDPGWQAAHEWATRQTTMGDARSSEYRAAGVGVGIAGKRADLAFIDDPFKSRKDADSDVRRDEVWNWYTDDVRTRLKPGGAIVIVNTRWHEDDLCGRILPEGYSGESGWVRARDGEWWFVVSIQALAERGDDILGREPGESYWPNYYSRGWLEQQRLTLTPRSWSALYQQRPSPEEGDYYKREWFQWYDPEQLPKHAQFYGASDYAVTQDGGDWTTHVVGAVAGNHMMEDLYLVDYWTGQTSSDTWISEFCDMVLRWKPTDWAEEHGQISKSLGPMIDLEQLRRKAWTQRVQMSVSGDKAQRGQSFRALAAQRRVYLPRGAPWANELLDRLLRFGASARDDDHDACGLLGRLVYQMRGGREAEKTAGKPQYGTFDWLLHVTDQQREAQRSLYRG
jgi:predicted phage terminase large subunit-like protein